MASLGTIAKALALSLLATACGQAGLGSSSQGQDAGTLDAAGAESDQVGFTSQNTSLFDAIRDAPFQVAYRGLRRVRASYPQSQSYDYREDVASDGQGAFAIEPLEMLGAHPNGELFLVLRSGQQAFDYRYRDFRILNSGLFQSSYQFTIDPTASQVLGRDCFHLVVQRAAPYLGGHYEVDVDTESSIVLQWKEFGVQGNLLAHVEFESFDLTPDLTGLDLITGFLTTTELDIHTSLDTEAGFDVLTPSLPPTGFELASATLLEQDTGETWIRQLYTDGLERAWLVHGPQQVAAGGASVPDDRLHVYTTGAWTVVAGIIDGFEIMAAGRVRKAQLMDMVESSF